jgi:hypothetical protein
MVITTLTAFSDGAEWPIKDEQTRLDRYARNALLYEGKHGEVWPELNPYPSVSSQHGFTDLLSSDRNHVDMAVNWHKRLTTVFADLLCGEPYKVTADPQETADRIIKDNALILSTYDLTMDVVRYGTGLFKIRFDMRGIIEVINPRLWYPIVSPDNAKEILAHVLAWSFKEGSEEYVRAEIHERGKITNKLFKVMGGKLRDMPLTTIARYATIEPVVETGVPEFLVIPVHNILGSDGVFGADDFGDLNDLVKELEKRLIQASRILTKHADPSITGPASKISVDPYSGEAVVIGGGQYFGYNPDEARPEYMVWDAKLDAAYQQIELIIRKLYMVSELSPAALGELKQGLAESGSALKRLMMPTLAKVNRLRLRVDPAIKDALRITAALEVVGRATGATQLTNIQITWADGLPRDEKEIVALEVARKNSALTSTEASLKRLDPEMSDADREEEATKIREEAPEML